MVRPADDVARLNRSEGKTILYSKSCLSTFFRHLLT
jgi:hypothetical protein